MNALFDGTNSLNEGGLVKVLPINKKSIMMTPETIVANAGRMVVFSFMEMISGIDPITSITANNMMNAEKISVLLMLSG